jgi:hypothetical protein
MTERPVFILGVGAEKSGTTWLASELWRHPAIGFAPAELHVWSIRYLRLDPERHPFARSVAIPRDEAAIAALPPGHPERELRMAGLASFDAFEAMRLDASRYVPYFTAILDSRPDIRAVGEKTPAYALLDRDHFLEIRGVLEDAGFDVRPVFVMRDPVERIGSSYRSWLGRNPPSGSGAARIRLGEYA